MTGCLSVERLRMLCMIVFSLAQDFRGRNYVTHVIYYCVLVVTITSPLL